MGTTTARKIGRRIIRIKEVSRRTGYSIPSIYRGMAEGWFPKQIKLPGGLAVGWLEDEIDALIQLAIDERDAGKPAA